MSEITGTAVVHEAYAFCCMRCGHGWEQAYDIEHHVDGSGQNVVVYKAEGVRVPSPLSSPTCQNCGGHVVRIMRSGQVSSVRALMTEQHHPAKTAKAAKATKTAKASKAAGTAEDEGGAGTEAQPGEEIPAQAPGGEIPAGSAGKTAEGHHHWHLSDLLHPFQHHHRP
ncbi:hypothetical protein ACIQVO_28565 [Streptomyces sp. NPDC101062]|uniref:hypothetical protein n=1 Tax=unclassified Streptomyces TaxID=2593676 RepID=UPI002E78D12B|nr:hypothetical protein [Streptomyces sp. JV176]MEE1799053.1 hypothetical protein [Streptomyces sp. JV176]